MTDIIVEDEKGGRMHFYIDDNWPAIVYVRKDGTIRVKKADLTPEANFKALALRLISF
ncbi:MAG: hypothetical protein QXN21_04480 [Candidatus Bathyarchaeia archaeon]